MESRKEGVVPPLRRRVSFVAEQKKPKVSLGASAPKYPKAGQDGAEKSSGTQNLSGLSLSFRGTLPLPQAKFACLCR